MRHINWIQAGVTAIMTVALYHAVNYVGWSIWGTL